MIYYTVVVNFKQSSYETMENENEVMIMLTLSKALFKLFQLMINLINDTANGK